MNLPPKPPGTVFGIRANGKLMNIGLPSIVEAEQAASGLVAQGSKVQIVDRVTGEVVKDLS